MFILSFDGGGVRGALAAAIAHRIEQAADMELGQAADLFAGTSTGGILALGLASGYRSDELVELYRRNAASIFRCRGPLDRVVPDEVWRANYDNAGLAGVMKRYFEDRRLGELRKRVLVPAFNLAGFDAHLGVRRCKPKFFHNFADSEDWYEHVADVAVRTASAPTYFPSYQGHVDGGLAANDPAMCAVAQAISSGTPLEQIRVLSIGAGVSPQPIEGDRHDWGIVHWARPLLESMLGAHPQITGYLCRQLLGDRYRRVDVVLPRRISLDEYGALNELITLADTLCVESCARWLLNSH